MGGGKTATGGRRGLRRMVRQEQGDTGSYRVGLCCIRQSRRYSNIQKTGGQGHFDPALLAVVSTREPERANTSGRTTWLGRWPSSTASTQVPSTDQRCWTTLPRYGRLEHTVQHSPCRTAIHGTALTVTPPRTSVKCGTARGLRSSGCARRTWTP